MKWRVEIAKTALEQLEKITDLRVRKKRFEAFSERPRDVTLAAGIEPKTDEEEV